MNEMPTPDDTAMELIHGSPEEQPRRLVKQLEDENSSLKSTRGTAICLYCGHEGERDPQKMMDHLLSCEKHPLGKALKELEVIALLLADASMLIERCKPWIEESDGLFDLKRDIPIFLARVDKFLDQRGV